MGMFLPNYLFLYDYMDPSLLGLFFLAFAALLIDFVCYLCTNDLYFLI